jgi:hypothetical protein
MNSFFEARIMDHFWGENSGIIDHPGLKVSGKYLSRSGYVRSEYRQVATNNEYSWNYPLNTYEIMSYNKRGNMALYPDGNSWRGNNK